MSPQVTVEHPDGSTETIPGTVTDDQGQSWTRTRELGKMRRARINVARTDAEAVSLTPKRDIIQLGDIDDLRLVDIETGGPTWVLVCYSLEWDSNREAHLPGGTTREGTDAELVTDLAGEVDSWTTGTVTEQSGPLSFVFNHAHQHEAIRRIEKNVSGEIRFRDRGTIDYVDRLGSDKSASVELSASAETIEGEIAITDRGRELDGTHIRVLGAHEGEAQLFANLVPQDDPDTYENEVRYSTPRWNGPEDTDWDRWVNKDVTSQDTIESEAESIGDELTESLVEAEATTNLTTLDVGDTVSVVKPDADLNRDMRIHRLKEIAEGATRKAKLLLSTRTTLRTDDTEDLRDIQRFNTGFQGASVWNQVGPVEQNVDSGEPLELEFYYPDIAYENLVELNINSLPYRYYISPTKHAHGFSVPDHVHEFSLTGDTSTIVDGDATEVFANKGAITLPGDNSLTSIDSATVSTQGYPYSVSIAISVDSGENATVRSLEAIIIGGRDSASATDILRSLTNNPGAGSDSDARNIENVYGSRLIPEDLSDFENVEIQVRCVTDSGGDVNVKYESRIDAIDPHTHSFERQTTTESGGATSSTTETKAGVDIGVETTLETATNVNVAVNDETVATDIGTGQFNAVIDLRDTLDTEAQNRIEIRTDSPGRFFAAVDIDAYKQIGKQ